MNSRSLAIAIAVVLGGVILAYTISEAVRQGLMLPLSYFLWRAGQFYRAVPQPLLWATVVVIVIYLVGLALVDISLGAPTEDKASSRKGQVETLARSLERREQGIFFKWQIANLLGDIATDILAYQDRLLPGRRLRARGWEPPPEVDRYLEAGLHSTFADYPSPSRFRPKAVTPFDIDLGPVLDNLESQLDVEEHDRQPG
jgi:hypothetical protein